MHDLNNGLNNGLTYDAKDDAEKLRLKRWTTAMKKVRSSSKSASPSFNR